MDPTVENYEKGREDRLSNLPIDILLHILSFLDSNDVVWTSLLSRKWRYIWLSVPILIFNFNTFRNDEQSLQSSYFERLSKFWVFVYYTLIYKNTPQVNTLSLSCQCFNIKQFRQLIVLFTLRNVQQLKIEAKFPFGDHAFYLTLYESLSQLRKYYENSVQLQHSTPFGNLKTLSLVGVLFSDADLVEELFRDCGVLEELYIENCRMFSSFKVFNISAHKLKRLSFVNVVQSHSSEFLFTGEMKIEAPNLVYFYYMGPVLRWELSNMPSLTFACIQIDLHTLDTGRCYSGLGALVSALHCANEMQLSSFLPLYFSPAFGGTACNLQNLCLLMLELNCDAHFMEGFINLLKLSPKLKVLIIKWSENEEAKIWNSRSEDLRCLSCCLERVEITSFDYSATSFEFIKCLLENGKVLKKMQILLKKEEVFSDMSDALRSVRLASKSVTLSVISVSDSGERNLVQFVLEKQMSDMEKFQKMKIN